MFVILIGHVAKQVGRDPSLEHATGRDWIGLDWNTHRAQSMCRYGNNTLLKFGEGLGVNDHTFVCAQQGCYAPASDLPPPASRHCGQIRDCLFRQTSPDLRRRPPRLGARRCIKDVKFLNDLCGVFDVPTGLGELLVYQLGSGLSLRFGHRSPSCQASALCALLRYLPGMGACGRMWSIEAFDSLG
jgi:hypothetical protein